MVDAAARTARVAEEKETQKEFTEAIKLHGYAAELYGQAAQNLKENWNGHERTPAEIANDRNLITSFG